MAEQSGQLCYGSSHASAPVVAILDVLEAEDLDDYSCMEVREQWRVYGDWCTTMTANLSDIIKALRAVHEAATGDFRDARAIALEHNVFAALLEVADAARAVVDAERPTLQHGRASASLVVLYGTLARLAEAAERANGGGT